MSNNVSAEMSRFNHLTSEINGVYHDAALKLGLADSAMQILYTICSYGEECLLNDITQMTGISKQTINSALRKLESKGVVATETVGGRKKIVRFTSQGKALAQETAQKIINIENTIFASWSDVEREAYLSLTQRFLIDLKSRVKTL